MVLDPDLSPSENGFTSPGTSLSTSPYRHYVVSCLENRIVRGCLYQQKKMNPRLNVSCFGSKFDCMTILMFDISLLVIHLIQNSHTQSILYHNFTLFYENVGAGQ